MLTMDPMGNTNLVTLESMPKFSSKHLIIYIFLNHSYLLSQKKIVQENLKVTGKVAADEDVPKPVIIAFI